MKFQQCIEVLLKNPKDLLSLTSGMSESDCWRAFFSLLEFSTSLEPLFKIGNSDLEKNRLQAAWQIGKNYALQSKLDSEPANHLLERSALMALEKIPDELRSAKNEWIGFVPSFASRKQGGFCLVERGVRTHVNFEPSDFFAKILVLRPRGFFLFHNHPSGILDASQSDLNLTALISSISSLLEIEMVGHWVVTSTSAKKIQRLS